MCFQAFNQRVVACVRRCSLVHDHDIETCKTGLAVAKRFPDDPLEPVSAAGLFTLLFRDGQPDAGNREIVAAAIVAAAIVAAAKHGKPFVPAACRFFEYTVK